MNDNKRNRGAAPTMSPSAVPIGEALDRAVGPRRGEADELLSLLSEVTGREPVVWAGRMVGFGEYEYRYASGHCGRAPELAFATGPKNHTIYLVSDFATRWPDLVETLGKNRVGKSCLHLTRLDDVDRAVLRTLLERSLAETRATHEG
ncbi:MULTISPECIES: DUF1801 domain-containing protein [Gordonia]|uniref:DUF1801 domain-containing protein n=1 Tax=Gordonia TaxID=2053 RepID=UPI00339958CA